MTRQPRGALDLAGRVLRVFGRALERLVIGIGCLVVLAALLAGVPWGLTRFIGWPLPNHMPSLDEVTTWLIHGSFGTDTLLDVLAIVCWIVWILFVLDVVASAIEAAHGIRWPEVELPSGVGRPLAAVIVGGLLWALLGHRDLTPAAAATMPSAAMPAVVALAPQHPGTGAELRTVTVARPVGGQHDSLWRIAERHLGDGTRWTEIWQLNKHRVQNDGRVFTDPDLIQPGWPLRMPHAQPASDPDRADEPSQDHGAQHEDRPEIAPPSGGESEPAPIPTARPVAPVEAPAAAQSESDPDQGEGGGTLVALGLAAAVSTALVIARHRHRRRRGPGSDMPVAPFAYDLHLAHLRAEAGELDEDSDADGDQSEEDDGVAPMVVTPIPAQRLTVGVADGEAMPGAATPSLGIRDDVEIALDLAATRGLGLIGEGAPAAARALLVATLAEHPGAATVLVPAGDLPELLGPQAASLRMPASLRVTPGIEDALAELETLTVKRARDATDEPAAPVLLIARPPSDTRRLTAVLANGARHGIVGVFLGQYPVQMCAYVADDGTITATPPGIAEGLRGVRLYSIRTQATEVIDLLRSAEPAPRDSPLEPPRPATAEAASNGHCDPAPSLTILHPAQAENTTDHPVDDVDPTASNAATAEPTDPRDGGLLPVPKPATDEDRGAETYAVEESAPTHDVSVETRDGGELAVNVFGPLQVQYRPVPDDADAAIDITDALQPKQAELLLLLALHPDGATRAAITDTIWRKPAKRVGNVFSTTLSRLRAALASATNDTITDAIKTGGGRYRLNTKVVTVDYWEFAAAVAARRAAVGDDRRVAADHAIIDAYGGALAEGLPADWVDTVRESARRDAVNAVSALARQLHTTDPQQTLNLLELARSFDPYNDRIYCDIMRIQARLGQPDAISRTLGLLRTRLTEIRERPDPGTIQLATALTERARTAINNQFANAASLRPNHVESK